MPVTISPQSQTILALCEKKIALQQEAETINSDVYSLLMKIKELSDRQAGVLAAMGEIDEQIERLAHSV